MYPDKLKEVIVKKHLAERFMDWAIGDRTFKFSFPLKFAGEVFHEIRDWFEDQPECRVPGPSWTTQKPKHHGFYWYRCENERAGEAVVVEVTQHYRDGRLVANSCDGEQFTVGGSPGEWWGPMVPPGDANA